MNEQYKVENLEEHNRQKIYGEVRKQQEEKLKRIKRDLDDYTNKLTDAELLLQDQNRELQEAKGLATVPLLKYIKELESKASRYRSQVAHFQGRYNTVRSELDKIIEGGVENSNYLQEGFMDMFSVKDQTSKVDQKVKSNLIELSISEGIGHRVGSKFYVSKLFYELLFNHQKEALQWLLYQHAHNRGSILADEMGLGKTITAIALISALCQTEWDLVNKHKEGISSDEQLDFGPFLIVCPATMINQWVEELKLWTTNLPTQLPILTFSSLDNQNKRTSKAKNNLIDQAFSQNGIIITSYEFLRSDIDIFQKREKGGWFYVILDEAQKIKNSESQINQAIMTISSKHRIILSGTPMQNNLQELWSLFNFVQPGLLGELDYFQNTFCKAILQGGFSNASDIMVQTAKQCLQELRQIINGHILRRTKKQLKIECKLPDRNEFIVFCELTHSQYKLYEHYLTLAREQMRNDFSRPEALAVLNNMRKICNHPFIYFNYMESPKGQASNFKTELLKLRCNFEYTTYKTAKNQIVQANERKHQEARISAQHWKMSGKLRVLISFLKEWKEQDPTTKVLIFSQTKKILDVIEKLAQDFDFSHLRMDGDVNLKDRIELIDTFNHNQHHYLFLLTTRVGGLGINLTAANKVIIFDPDWNPMVDIQATDRALRIGQKREVTIYRFVVEDSIEEKIYHRQIFKKFMADKVLQDPTKQRLFDQQSMHELFELPKKSQQKFLVQLKPAEPKQPREELKLNEASMVSNKRQKISETEEVKVGDENPPFEENEIENFKPERMYKLNHKNIQKDQKAQSYIQQTSEQLQKQATQTEQYKSTKDLKEELIVQIFKEEDENEVAKDFGNFSNKKILAYFQAREHTEKILGGLQTNKLPLSQPISSLALIANLKSIQAQQIEQTQIAMKTIIKNPQELQLSDETIKARLKIIFEKKFEMKADEVMDEFKDYIPQDIRVDGAEEAFERRTDQIKAQLKKIAFWDKKDKVWMLRD